MALWRYNSNGTIDTTFNGRGWVTHDNAAGGNGYDVGASVAADAGGKIVVAGKSIGEHDEDIAIWRYNSDGSLDTSFGDIGNKCGWVTHNSAAGGNSSEGCGGMVIDSAGKILIAGNSLNDSGNYDMVIWCYE